ncbi:hypothetical protein [Arthrobacter sp. Y81]|uniref:hypothetical protein n=1 Tax=Arthrobacter sp. Y81 TaxID=2058897 RepID=UPI000CE2FB86|nr:hypothetical protein [Arthrobacter sp. Y81]
MTTRDDFSGTVDQLLLDAGHTGVPDLRAALLSIASLAEMHAPVPGPELALMLAGPRDEITRQRWLRKHRPAVVGLAVLAGMGLGVSGVAATSQVSGDGAGPWSVQELTTDWTPGWTLPLAPVAADRGGRITWVSPLFLQTDRAHPAAVHAAAEPAAQAAGADATAVEPAPPAASDGDRGQSPVGEGQGPGANGKPGQANHGKATPGKAASGQAMTGRAPDQAYEQGAAITPDGVKIGSTVEAAVDSTVDSALDSVSSWLGKFRR